MNMIELLKDDHKSIVALITKLWHEVKEVECTEQDVVDCERMRIFGQLRDATTQYADIEGRFFYPALEEFVDTRALISEANRAHQRIRALVGKMEGLRLAGQCDRWDDDLTQLIQSIQRHFDWEEHALFPKAIRLLGEARLEKMLFEMERVPGGRAETDTSVLSPRRSGVGI